MLRNKRCRCSLHTNELANNGEQLSQIDCTLLSIDDGMTEPCPILFCIRHGWCGISVGPLLACSVSIYAHISDFVSLGHVDDIEPRRSGLTDGARDRMSTSIASQ